MPSLIALCRAAAVVLFIFVLLAAGADANNNTVPCQTAPFNSYPYCNASLTAAERTADLLSRMTVAEKISQFGNTAASIPSLGIGAYQWWNEGLHGLAYSPGVSFEGTTPYATSFPEVITLGAAFNKTLYGAIGNAISTEARAFANQGHAGLTYYTPNINVFRDPRWGRGQETPGEDPYHTAQYVAHLVRGLQEGEDPRYLKLAATCKHFSCYDLEDWGDVNRYNFTAEVTSQELVESYLPAFESCVRDARGASIMCSYNAVEVVSDVDPLPSTPSCANNWFNNDIVRGQWGWEGFIVSDCGAVSCIQYNHHYTNTTDATVAAALRGGCDMDCGGYYGANMESALNASAISEDNIDTALGRMFEHRILLGTFDDPNDQPYMQIPASAANSEVNQELALDAARQGIALLQNGVLSSSSPLSSSAAVLPWTLPAPGQTVSVAVVGPNGDATTVMQGNYYGAAPFLISPTAGLAGLPGVNATYAMGCEIDGTSTADFAAAEALARASDYTVIVIGLNETQEAEMHDRTSIALPGVQEGLVQAVAEVAAGPVAVVYMGGGPCDLTFLASMDVAVVWVGYPGQAGGQALAEVLFGMYNPGGRLPYTIYPADYVNQLPMTDMSFRSPPGRTYRFYTGPSPYPFGTGLSYTTFSFAWATSEGGGERVVSVDDLLSGRLNAADYAVNVTNTGKVAGSVVALAFVTRENDTSAPLKQLTGYARVFLQPGESDVIFFAPEARDLAAVDTRGRQALHPGTTATLRIGTEADNGPVARLRLKGSRTAVLYQLPPKSPVKN